jgi:hypothetical protein
LQGSVSIGFIDGLHYFEQALKDFINLEAWCDPNSVVILHDTLPLDEVTQHRERKASFYTGDVWKTVLCLKHYRPDLDIFTIATPPSGLTVVTSLDPASRILSDKYEEAVARFIDAPFSIISSGSEAMLNVVPNEWNAVKSRLSLRLAGLSKKTGLSYAPKQNEAFSDTKVPLEPKAAALAAMADGLKERNATLEKALRDLQASVTWKLVAPFWRLETHGRRKAERRKRTTN